VPHGVDDATTDTDTIARWWRQCPRANVSVALKPAGLLMVDPDSDLARADAHKRGMGQTIIRRSRNDAYLFEAPDDCPAARVIHDGPSGALDVLTDGYALVYGTHASGAAIELDENHQIGPAPAWAVALVTRKTSEKADRQRRTTERAAGATDGDTEPPVRLHSRGVQRWLGELVQLTDGRTDTSESLFYLGLDLAECNASHSAIVAALAERDVALGWNKYTDRADGAERYGEIANKAIDREDARRQGGTADLLSWPTLALDPASAGPANGECSPHCAKHHEVIEAQRAIIAELRADLQQLQTTDTANGKRLSHLKHFRQTSTFSGKRKDTIEAIGFAVERARQRGQSETTLFYGDRIEHKEGRDPGGIAGASGTSPQTVGTAVEILRAARTANPDAVPWRFVSYQDSNGFPRVKVAFDPASTIERDLARLAALPKAVTVRKEPLRCPDCPTAKLHVSKTCTRCGQVVAEYTETPPQPTPLVQTVDLVQTLDKDSPGNPLCRVTKVSEFWTRPEEPDALAQALDKDSAATPPPSPDADVGFDSPPNGVRSPWLLQFLTLGSASMWQSMVLCGVRIRQGAKHWESFAAEHPDRLPRVVEELRTLRQASDWMTP